MSWNSPRILRRIVQVFTAICCRRMMRDLIILGGGPQSPQPTDLENLPGSWPVSRISLGDNFGSPCNSRKPRRALLRLFLRSKLLMRTFPPSYPLPPLALEKTGKPSMGRHVLVKNLCDLLYFWQGLNLDKENSFETPDF